LNILLTLDRNYLPALRVLLTSIFLNNPGEALDVYIADVVMVFGGEAVLRNIDVQCFVWIVQEYGCEQNAQCRQIIPIERKQNVQN